MCCKGTGRTLEIFIRGVLRLKAIFWKINLAAVYRMISKNELRGRRVCWKIVKGIQV